MTVSTRFHAYYVDGHPASCWEWTGERSELGQALLSDTPAATLAWVQANGPVPTGSVVRQRCGNWLCVNPDHLALQA